MLTDMSLIAAHDMYLFREGNDFRLYDKPGTHRFDDTVHLMLPSLGLFVLEKGG